MPWYPTCALRWTSPKTTVERIGAGHASIFINLVPVFAVMQAAILLGERLGLAVLLGGLLVIGGVWLTTRQQALQETAS